MHLRLISLSTSDPLRDWSWVRKWARVGTRELLGPTRTGTVNFHREHKVGSLAYDGHNIPPYRHV